MTWVMPQCIPHYSALSAILPLVASTNWRTKTEECHLLLEIITRESDKVWNIPKQSVTKGIQCNSVFTLTTAVIVVESFLPSLSLWSAAAALSLTEAPDPLTQKSLPEEGNQPEKIKHLHMNQRVMATGSKYYNDIFSVSPTFRSCLQHGTAVWCMGRQYLKV